jgi:hypothetical protein
MLQVLNPFACKRFHSALASFLTEADIFSPHGAFEDAFIKGLETRRKASLLLLDKLSHGDLHDIMSCNRGEGIRLWQRILAGHVVM